MVVRVEVVGIKGKKMERGSSLKVAVVSTP
jgi:hypothetical protein